MSVVFVLLGLMNLIILFYEKDKLSKIFLCVSLSFSLLSFFAGDLIFHNLEFNIFLLFSLIILLIFLSFKCSIKFNNISYIVFVNLAYILLTEIDDIYVTSFKPIPIIFIAIGFSIFMLKRPYEIMLSNIIAFILIETKNYFYFLDNFGFANILNVDFLINISSLILISLCLNLILKGLKLMKRRKADEVEI